MTRFVKALAIALAIGALMLPVATTSACGDAHETECMPDCSCVCHTVSSFDCHENSNLALALIAQRAVVSEAPRQELLLLTDIFRPPALA